MGKNQLSTKDLCNIGLWAAVVAVMAQIAIPMPLGVPMTMQTFAITLAAIILGPQKGGLAVLVYVLLGAIGLPVFANFSGGLGVLLGPTGGFIISFPIMAFVIGLSTKTNNKVLFITWIVLGTVINYVIGVAMFCMMTQNSIAVGITACVLPFIPTAIIKAVVATILGLKMKVRMVKIA